MKIDINFRKLRTISSFKNLFHAINRQTNRIFYLRGLLNQCKFYKKLCNKLAKTKKMAIITPLK